MWCSRVVSRTTRNSYLYGHVRLAHQAHQAASYLHNPGNEPLIQSTIGEVIAATAHRHPGRIAIRSLQENVTLTYEQLIAQADALGCALRSQGLERGDRVGVWVHNNAAWIVSIVGAARAGLVPVALNPAYETNELSFCVRKTEMKSLIIGNKLSKKDYYAQLRQAIPELSDAKPGALKSKAFPSLTSIISCEKENLPGTFTIGSLLSEHARADASQFSRKTAPGDGSIIYFTSGTTGEPKAALDSHLGIVNNIYFTGLRNTFHQYHHTICVQAPLFHALGSIVTTLSGLLHGATMVLPGPLYNVQNNVNAVLSEKCTSITGTPTMYVDMLSVFKSKNLPPTSLRMALAAGAPCSPQLIRDIKNTLKAETVMGLYGLTESTACIFQSLPDDSIDCVAETVGYIQDHVEVKVVDENGKQVPFGAPGELMSRGYNTMLYYWNEPEKTKKTIDKDGWLGTGDKFTISEDGYAKIVGRLKDIIVRGGENIAPKEIEDLLNTHPDIVESQVVGVNDDRLGEELCAVIRVRDGAPVNLHDITKFCTGKLAKFKIPRLLKIADEFPKTTSGKIKKFRLKELIEEGKL